MDKKHITIGTIGHHQHGKTSLMHAIALYAKSKNKHVKFSGDIGITEQGLKFLDKFNE